MVEIIETQTEKVGGGLRLWLGITGVLAVIAGILVLVWPKATGVAMAVTVTWLIALYAIVGGLTYALSGVFTTKKAFWSRVGRVVFGLLVVASGVIALANIGQTAVFFVFFTVIMIGVAWIMEGILTLATLSSAPSKGWSTFVGIIMILAGISVAFSPLQGVATLWWVFGIGSIVYGVMQVLAAVTGRAR